LKLYCPDPTDGLGDVLEREVLDDERKIGPPGPQEVEIGPLREDARAELGRGDLGPVRPDVLEVRDHEAVLEAVEERPRDPLLRRQQVP
jgi:hypothetical protein